MDLRQLRYFVAVVDTGSISRAAQRLFIRQPTLSDHIRRLEAELGIPLLVRAAKGVIPTDAGQALFARAKELICAVEQLSQLVKHPGRASAPTVKIGFAPSLLELLLPELGESLRQHGIAFEPVELSANAQVTALQDGDLAYGFVRLPGPPAGVEALCDMEDPWVVAAHADHEAATHRRAVSLTSFAGDAIVFAREGPSPALRDQIGVLCAAAGFTPASWIEASSVHGALSMARARIGSAIVPSSSVLLARFDDVRFFPIREQVVRARVLFLAGKRGTDHHGIVESVVPQMLLNLFSRIQGALRRPAAVPKEPVQM